MTITKALLDAGRSNRKGWNRSQLAILGVPWPPPSGWKNRVSGKTISATDAKRFLALRGIGFKMTKRNRMKSELSIPCDMDTQKARTVDSFWIWVNRLGPEDRREIQAALIFMARPPMVLSAPPASLAEKAGTTRSSACCRQ